MWEVTFEYPVSVSKAGEVIYSLAKKYSVANVGGGVDLQTNMRDVQYEGGKKSIDAFAKAVKSKVKHVSISVSDQEDFSDLPAISSDEVEKARSRLKKLAAAQKKANAKWVAKTGLRKSSRKSNKNRRSSRARK